MAILANLYKSSSMSLDRLTNPTVSAIQLHSALGLERRRICCVVGNSNEHELFLVWGDSIVDGRWCKCKWYLGVCVGQCRTLKHNWWNIWVWESVGCHWWMMAWRGLRILLGHLSNGQMADTDAHKGVLGVWQTVWEEHTSCSDGLGFGSVSHGDWMLYNLLCSIEKWAGRSDARVVAGYFVCPNPAFLYVIQTSASKNGVALFFNHCNKIVQGWGSRLKPCLVSTVAYHTSAPD